MRVRLAPTTGARISLTVRPRGGKAFRRTVVAKAGRFSLRLPPRFRGTVLARFAGNVAFRPARASLRVRR